MASVMEQWSSGRWSTHNWFRLWRNGCAGAKGGGVCTTGLAQVRFGTGTKGAGIGAQLWSNRAVGASLREIGLGYGEMGARNETGTMVRTVPRQCLLLAC